MSPTPQFTQAQLDALNAAIASGVTEVRYQDRTVRYDSMRDLLTARAIVYQSLNPPNSLNAPTRQYRLRGEKDL
jgi:hypothetical protein